MRSISKVALLVVLAFTCARAQQQSNPAPANQEKAEAVAVIKFKWNKFVERPDWDRPVSMRPAGNEPQSSVKQTVIINQPQTATIGRPERIPRASADLGVPGSQVGSGSGDSLWGVRGFQYHVTVTNTGDKAIKLIFWDYAFISRDERKTIEHHQCANRVNIKPGQTKEIIFFSTTPPTQTISAAAPRDGLQPHTESVIITRIEYADGQVWQRQPH